MKTNKCHISNFGKFAPLEATVDFWGYIKYHDSDRYAGASDPQLHRWVETGNIIVRNAAAIELAERRIQTWRAQ